MGAGRGAGLMDLERMRRHGAGGSVDAVVIGTGAGGAPLLAALAAAGCSVIALEAGRHHDPMAFSADEPTQAAAINWMGERLSGGAMPEAFGPNNSGIGVGGSMLHWGAFCPRPTACDLSLRTETGEGADWPVSLDELRPHYETLEAWLGVSGPDPYPWDEARRYTLPPVARNTAAMIMASACDALGIRATDAPAAVLSRPRRMTHGPDRAACINCGACHQGCRVGAKTSMDTSFLPLAVAHGAEIRAECTAHGFVRDGAGRITAVLYRDAEGRDHRQDCRAVFLCGGAVETPRLLLHTGLANANGMVGRNYMAHVATQVWGTFDRETRPNKGYPSSLISEDYVRCGGGGFAGGYLIQSLGVMPVTWATTVARGRGLWGEALVDYLDQYNHVAGLGINGECLPRDDNRLVLADETDAHGIPKVRISFGYGPNERALDAHATRTMVAIWEAAGARDIWVAPRAAHTIGTCRMGDDPADSVVDRFGRAHEIDNLWICDNSVFPSSLAANPALTIMALSRRTAGAFLGTLPALVG